MTNILLLNPNPTLSLPHLQVQGVQVTAGEEEVQALEDRLPVPVQQQLQAADGGQGGPQLPLVLPQLRGAVRAAQAPQAVASQVPFHIRGKIFTP